MYCDLDNLMLSIGSKLYGLISDSVVISGSSGWRRTCWGTSLVRWSFISRIELLKPCAQHSVSSLQKTELFGFCWVYMRGIRGFNSIVYWIITVRDEKG